MNLDGWMYDERKYKKIQDILVDFPILLSSQQISPLTLEDSWWDISYEYLQENKKNNLEIKKQNWLPLLYFFLEWRNFEITVNNERYKLNISRKNGQLWQINLWYLNEF